MLHLKAAECGAFRLRRGNGARALHAACMVRLSLFFGKAGKKTYILFVFRREQSSCLEKAKAQRAISEFLRGAPYPTFFPAAESGWTAPISSAPLRLCTTVQTALAAASPATAFTRNMRNSMRSTFSIIM